MPEASEKAFEALPVTLKDLVQLREPEQVLWTSVWGAASWIRRPTNCPLSCFPLVSAFSATLENLVQLIQRH